MMPHFFSIVLSRSWCITNFDFVINSIKSAISATVLKKYAQKLAQIKKIA